MVVRVQRVVMPVTGAESWAVVDHDFCPVGPVEDYMSYMTAIERSPNTVRAYASSLKLWFDFLEKKDLEWDHVGVDVVGMFVGWLRAPADNVIVLDASASVRTETTVNRHLATLFSFYDYHARAGVGLAGVLVAWRRVGRGAYKPFLHHVTKGREIATRPLRLRAPRHDPRARCRARGLPSGGLRAPPGPVLVVLVGRNRYVHRSSAGAPPR
jgi:hypothetical protein